MVLNDNRASQESEGVLLILRHSDVSDVSMVKSIKEVNDYIQSITENKYFVYCSREVPEQVVQYYLYSKT